MSKKLVITTGVSGSGKSVALNALEDEGYNCIDNLPVSLFAALVSELAGNPSAPGPNVAVGIDARSTRGDLHKVLPLIALLRGEDITVETLYLDAEDDILLRRFSETRRKHPLTEGERGLAEAIRLERDLLEPLLKEAALRIDTTRLTVHELRDIVRQRVGQRRQGSLSLSIESFGFKHGIPRNADMVFDARCLPNPHWEPELRPLTGKDEAVVAFLESDTRVATFTEHMTEFLDTWVPCYESEGRSYFTVAVGCTGGHHRSVYLVERLARHFRERGRQALIRHRELP